MMSDYTEDEFLKNIKEISERDDKPDIFIQLVNRTYHKGTTLSYDEKTHVISLSTQGSEILTVPKLYEAILRHKNYSRILIDNRLPIVWANYGEGTDYIIGVTSPVSLQFARIDLKNEKIV